MAKHSRLAVPVVVGRLHELAHEVGAGMVITAHVNAAGLVRGGPEVAHGTDAVLMIVGDPRASRLRTLIADKNRAGDTTISTQLEMTDAGFRDVVEAPVIPRRALGIGAALALVRVGDKLEPVEVQVMSGPTLSNPRRITTAGGTGVERVRVLVAVAEREGVVVAGDVTARAYGIVTGDPGTLDAAIVAALVSASEGRA